MSMVLFSHWREVPEHWWGQFCPDFHPLTDPMLVTPDTGAFQFDIPSMQALQEYRDTMGPTRINSGYRSEVYNARLPRSSPVSMHFRQIAFDLAIGPRDRHEMRQVAREVGFTGIGMYVNFVHLDRGRRREWFGSTAAREMWQNSQ